MNVQWTGGEGEDISADMKCLDPISLWGTISAVRCPKESLQTCGFHNFHWQIVS